MTPEQFAKLGMKQNPDGTFSKAKTVLQPREKGLGTAIIKSYKPSIVERGYGKKEKPISQRITIMLKGEPMPKQSVRATKSGHFFQPKKTVDRKKDYQRQLREQLPKDFVMYESEIRIIRLNFVFAPLKAFHKQKGKMDLIREGNIFYKTTKPDLDNLLKPLLDSMSNIVFKDDAIITQIDGVKKYYGATGGFIHIILEGY